MFPLTFLGFSSSAPVGLALQRMRFATDVPIANNLDTIPAPLLDRMEVLEVSGYVSEEKAVIADKYLGPQAKESSGLKEADVLLEPSAVDVLIKYYCRESGVRNLKKHIEKVCMSLLSLTIIKLSSCFRFTERLHSNSFRIWERTCFRSHRPLQKQVQLLKPLRRMSNLRNRLAMSRAWRHPKHLTTRRQ